MGILKLSAEVRSFPEEGRPAYPAHWQAGSR